MDNLMTARPLQTLYVTIRRDELRQLRDERELLMREVAHLQELLQQFQPADYRLPVTTKKALHN
ncbi:MAG: DUF6026 family protein [Pseudomonadota bacterium]|uniref:DUF6026 family protein n=1 Tax=Pseudomonas sp. Ant30-3 TaxID=1488328 RepID=UPI00048B17B1|nr:DUF6026 family protein [Pseudomonas sp. Ant30-3]MDQ3202556.1 DUF6026 family protein [Pseudomonadota bacterium]